MRKAWNVRARMRHVRDTSESTILVSESGNMLIMLLAQARASGDGSLLAQHVRSVLAVWHRPCLTDVSKVQSDEAMGRLPCPELAHAAEPVCLPLCNYERTFLTTHSAGLPRMARASQT